jgi:tetratricopeptide (TPR) repeat protein
MKFQGDITSIPITDVAQNLASNRKGGTLFIRRAGGRRSIAFRDGKIISYSDDSGFSVPRWLEEKGLVEPDVLKRAVAKARRTRKKDLGDFLQAAGAMKAEEYRDLLKSLVQDMLYETFTFREGTFEFAENELPAQALDTEVTGAGLELAVGPILIEAARRLDDWEEIRKWVPSEDDIYRVSPSERDSIVAEFEDHETAQAAVDLLDGTRTIREVIAALPVGRFEAYRAIAALVTRKFARPIDGAEVLAHFDALKSPREKARVFAQLKAALEREPGNRVLLRRVAELSQRFGKKEDSAILHKLLAPALYDDGDAEGAERALRESIKLNPRDIGAWQKLYDLLGHKGDEDALLSFGATMARNLRKMGVEELARDHLQRMVERFPSRIELHLDLAAARYALGEKAAAVEGLLELVRDLLKKGLLDPAEQALARVIEYDRGHKRAKEIYEKIRSGKLARQKARRRTIRRGVLVVLFCISAGTYIGDDFLARREFALATREVFAEGLLEKGEYRKAAQRLDAVSRRHPYSLLRFFEGRDLPQVLRESARKQEGAVPPARITPLPKAPVKASAPAPAPAAKKASPPAKAGAPEPLQKR